VTVIRLLIHLLLLRPFLRIVFGVSVVGRENLTGLNRFILVANHNSHLDVLLLYAILPVRQIVKTHPVAARDYFSRHPWLLAALDYLFQPIWVDRAHREGDPIGEILQCLDRGHSIIIFPEGTRGEAGKMQEFKTGVCRVVARRNDVPVVPVFLFGPERSFPRQARFPVPLWNHATVGPPRHPTGEIHDAARSLQQEIEDLGRAAWATRHRRRAPRPAAHTIAVLGIDGSGKSTLARELARVLSDSRDVALISDGLELFRDGRPKELQPLIVEKVREWIGAQAKHAKSLARYKIPKLTELLLRDRILAEAHRWYRPEIIVMDGSPLLNMTAWAVLYREEYFSEEFCARAIGIMSSRNGEFGTRDPLLRRFPELKYLRSLGLNRLRVPDAAIFLDVHPGVALGRIEARGQQKQVHETEEKLAKLRDAYRMVCRVVEQRHRVFTCSLDGARELTDVVADAQTFVRGAWERHDAG